MAIDDLLDEHEQSERVRNWVRNNAIGVIGGIALGLGVIVGFQWWQGQRLHARMGANAEYARAMAEAEAGKLPADKGAALIARLDKANPKPASVTTRSPPCATCARRTATCAAW